MLGPGRPQLFPRPLDAVPDAGFDLPLLDAAGEDEVEVLLAPGLTARVQEAEEVLVVGKVFVVVVRHLPPCTTPAMIFTRPPLLTPRSSGTRAALALHPVAPRPGCPQGRTPLRDPQGRPGRPHVLAGAPGAGRTSNGSGWILGLVVAKRPLHAGARRCASRCPASRGRCLRGPRPSPASLGTSSSPPEAGRQRRAWGEKGGASRGGGTLQEKTARSIRYRSRRSSPAPPGLPSSTHKRRSPVHIASMDGVSRPYVSIRATETDASVPPWDLNTSWSPTEITASALPRTRVYSPSCDVSMTLNTRFMVCLSGYSETAGFAHL